MKVGVQLPEVERRVSWPELADMARLIESLGFDSIWVGEHLLYEEEGNRLGPWEAWSVLAALAAVTERVAIGPLVAALPFHNPALLAKQAATVDEISGGRLILGVGAGWNPIDFKGFGLPYERRVERFAEGFDIVRRLLAGERLDHIGEFYRLEGAELLPPPRPGGPPLMIGSTGSRMLEITLPYVAMWNSWYRHFDNRPEQLTPLLTRIDQACRRVGRDPESLERSVALLLKFDEEPSRRSSGFQPIAGTPRQMANVLDRVRDQGVSHVQLVLDPITAESIEGAAEVKDLL
ncbi:MAG TPA: LLM class flavin-dependent oxidoreductase [Acidimicrobiia bacterium]|nr:LLM class flavin-dependent oxidoreductase [Acidimicrobiia bacterium]